MRRLGVVLCYTMQTAGISSKLPARRLQVMPICPSPSPSEAGVDFKLFLAFPRRNGEQPQSDTARIQSHA
jgi:hypothetical protein